MGDNCDECNANTDPRKVPVHPHCNCEVVTQSVVTGIDVDVWNPIERWVKENGELRFIPGNIGPPASTTQVETGDDLLDITLEALSFDPSSMLVLDVEEARWGDIEKWLESVSHLVDTGQYYISISSNLEDPKALVEQAEALNIDLETLVELLHGRLFVALVTYKAPPPATIPKTITKLGEG